MKLKDWKGKEFEAFEANKEITFEEIRSFVEHLDKSKASFCYGYIKGYHNIKEDIEKHCLDKQKVRNNLDSWENNIYADAILENRKLLDWEEGIIHDIKLIKKELGI